MSTRLEIGADINHPKETQPREADFHQRVGDKFQSAFAEAYQTRVSGADDPQVETQFFSSAHNTKADLRELGQQFKEYDPHILVPEGVGWGQKDLNLLRQSSSGSITDTQLRRKLKDRSVDFRTEAEVIRGSNKAITFIDVPYSQFNKEEFSKAWTYNPSFDGNFPEALEYTKGFLENLALHINKREKNMLDQINSEKVEELLDAYPSLKNIKTIRILLTLGSAHAPMPSDFSNHSFTNEGILRNKFGKEVSDELATQIFLEFFIHKYLSTNYGTTPSNWFTDDSNKLDRFKRLFIGRMKWEEVREDAERIFYYIKKSVGKWGVIIPPMNELESIFKERGLQIPNPKKLDEYLNNPIPPQPKIAA